jgi:hypothetical protein
MIDPVGRETLSPERARGEVVTSTEDESLFGKFFGEARDCVFLMQQYGCIASGASVLNVLKPGGTPASSKLELIAMESALGNDGYFEWHQMFRGAGYEVTRDVVDTDRMSTCYFYENVRKATSVRFTVTQCEPVRYVVENAWSTHLMNIATWEGIYCPFPNTTLTECRMFLLRRPTAEELQLFDEYSLFGYLKLSEWSVQQRREFTLSRCVGDELTRIVRFGRRFFSVGPNEVLETHNGLRRFSFSCVGGTVRAAN